MEYSLYALTREPFEGFFPQDILLWLKNDISDAQLAEAYAAVHEQCSTIMMFASDDDTWADQAYDDWKDVENELISAIISRMKKPGMPLTDKKGTHLLIAPFLEANGYGDAH